MKTLIGLIGGISVVLAWGWLFPESKGTFSWGQILAAVLVGGGLSGAVGSLIASRNAGSGDGKEGLVDQNNSDR